jgi:hypothetical protein
MDKEIEQRKQFRRRYIEILKEIIRIASPTNDEGPLAHHIHATYFSSSLWKCSIDIKKLFG